MRKSDPIAVIGAGVGGLATAARLASRGYKVDVFERLPVPGGRNNILEDQGFKIDLGPSFVLMPDFFEEFFSFCKESINDHLTLKILDPSYKIFYPNKESLTVHKDSNRTRQELEKFEENSRFGFDRFINHTELIYNTVSPLLTKCFTKRSLLDSKNWPLLFKLDPFSTYWDLAKRFFQSEELCYAFTFEAMFMGVSPF